MDMLGHFPYSNSLSDVWGYVDENGNEYALVGVYDGFSVVDVTDPASPSEVFFGPGPQSIWRDIKTWGDYAYVSNESFGGVYIIDLSPLPGGEIQNTTNFTGSQYPFESIHNLYIDEFGKLYIFGSSSGVGGAIICDLTQDPMNPVELGRFDNFYLHDGMARGDTLWGGAIYEGVLAAIDVSNPANTQVMGTVSTPSQFTHNAWVSDDGSHVFTSDEVSSGYIGAFNVTDLSNIIETDRIRSSTGSDVIPHNVHVLDDFLITSYYADGVTIHDASNPSNLVEVGFYDTSPNYSGTGYNGSWGAYPFLPSGNILASDIEGGLYILSVEYKRAAFLQGVVTSEETGDPIFNVNVMVMDTDLETQTAFDGTYKFGTTISGIFDVEFSHEEYASRTIPNVEFLNGEIVELNVTMSDQFVTEVEEGDLVEQFNLYPNPFISAITIEYQFELNSNESLTISIYNTMGKQIQQVKPGNSNGSISVGGNLPSGVYFVKVGNGTRLGEIQRIVKL